MTKKTMHKKIMFFAKDIIEFTKLPYSEYAKESLTITISLPKKELNMMSDVLAEYFKVEELGMITANAIKDYPINEKLVKNKIPFYKELLIAGEFSIKFEEI